MSASIGCSPLREAFPFVSCLPPVMGRLLAAENSECRPRWTVAEQGQDVSAVLEPIRELVAGVPPPCRDHRKNKPPALVEQLLIDVPIVRADVLRQVCNIEFDWTTAARLEVDEQRPVLRDKDVAWVRFAVEQLLVGPAAKKRAAHAPQRAEKEIPIHVSERRRLLPVHDELLSRGDSFREMRCRALDRPHPVVQAMECVGVAGWRALVRRNRFVVGPKGHRETVSFVDARLDSWLKRRDRAPNGGEPRSKLYLKRGDLLSQWRYSREDVTRQKT